MRACEWNFMDVHLVGFAAFSISNFCFAFGSFGISITFMPASPVKLFQKFNLLCKIS